MNETFLYSQTDCCTAVDVNTTHTHFGVDHYSVESCLMLHKVTALELLLLLSSLILDDCSRMLLCESSKQQPFSFPFRLLSHHYYHCSDVKTTEKTSEKRREEEEETSVLVGRKVRREKVYNFVQLLK